MKPFLVRNYHRVVLVCLYLLTVWYVKYNYPNPVIAWDTNYYLAQSITGDAGIRPEGYPVFLAWLYNFSESLNAVLVIQFVLYFASIVTLLEVLAKVFGLKRWLYVVTGILMLLEPTGLFFTNTIYSDQPFSVLTNFYLATLLLFCSRRKVLYLLLHAIVLFCCLEIRFLSLFYPIFSIATILFWGKKGWVIKIVGMVLVFYTFQYSYNRNVELNKQAFNVPIHSAFAGWTQANNVMYALPRINTPAKFIKDPELRDMHAWFLQYFDTATNIQIAINTEYLWAVNGPLFPFAQKANDSLWGILPDVPLYMDFFCAAQKLERYGLYIQRQYPYEFLMGYLLPNAKTMLKPHQGEMSDYYYHPNLSDDSKERYHVQEGDISCRKDVFKEWINAVNDKWYPRRLLLFALASLGFVWLWRKKHLLATERRTLIVLTSFVFLFYAAMIYSSWCIYRYLLPVLPIMTALTIIVVYRILYGKRIEQPTA